MARKQANATPDTEVEQGAAVEQVQDESTPEAIIVRGPALGRWRAGRHFAPEPTTLLLSDLTEDEIEAITSDPELSVSSS